MNKCRLSPMALGLAFGFFWGISVLVMGLMAHYYAFGEAFVTSVGTLYVTYGPSMKGSLMGGLYAFIHAFISGVILAWFYNLFGGCHKNKGNCC